MSRSESAALVSEFMSSTFRCLVLVTRKRNRSSRRQYGASVKLRPAESHRRTMLAHIRFRVKFSHVTEILGHEWESRKKRISSNSSAFVEQRPVDHRIPSKPPCISKVTRRFHDTSFRAVGVYPSQALRPSGFVCSPQFLRQVELPAGVAFCFGTHPSDQSIERGCHALRHANVLDRRLCVGFLIRFVTI